VAAVNETRIDPRTGEVTHRPVLKKHPLTRRHRVVVERVDSSKTIDSRFDSRRSPIKWKSFHPRNIGVVYLYVLIWIVFTIWVPDTWLTWLTHRSVLNSNAILMVVAVGLLVPLAAGVFDLSIAGTISASAVMVSWGMVEAGWSMELSILAALLVGVIVGNLNGLLVVWIRIDSFICTLGMGSILTAFAVWRSNNRSMLGFPDSFKSLATEFAFGLNKTVLVALVASIVLWFVFEHTAAGRYLFATGGAREAARLAGVQTDRYVWGSLVTSAVVASLGGVMLAAQFGSTQAQSGSPYLLPAFAAAFLGSTQFKRRFNVWGTVLAVFVLQSGVKGLQLAGVGTTWIESLFFGVALIVAVGLSSYRKRVHGGRRRWWRREESGPEHLLGKLMGWGKLSSDQSKQNAEQWWFDPNDSEGHHIKAE
jgi:ribose transport system permease protein